MMFAPAWGYYYITDIWQLPNLDTTQLITHEEKRLAHKVLAFLASHYVWQNGKKNPAEASTSVLSLSLSLRWCSS